MKWFGHVLTAIAAMMMTAAGMDGEYGGVAVKPPGQLSAQPDDAPPGPIASDPDRVSGTEKGSLLIFPKVELRWDTQGQLIQDTFITLTNDYPGSVWVQMFFINGDPPLEGDDGERPHPGWNRVGVMIQLTPNQPTYWSALTGDGMPGPGVLPWTILDPGDPPGRPDPENPDERMLRGYIVALAVDNMSTEEIKWNHLAGNGTLINYRNGYAWEYNAYAFQMLDPDGEPGVLNLDGGEYVQAFSFLLMNFQAVDSLAFSQEGLQQVRSDTDLTLLPVTVDLRQNNDGPVTTKADFDIHNQWEAQFSGTHRCITCWDQTLLGNYDSPNHFPVEFLQTDHGSARINGEAADGECPDSVDAALLGVAARLLTHDGGNAFSAAGTNLAGMGFMSATIKYDTIEAPPPFPLGTARDQFFQFLKEISLQP
ncbi:MAG: hypothetical protein SYC29_03715 [Planctomycetota bacterium]|nr:hypothetical protein [Planctomycetota bacterium]